MSPDEWIAEALQLIDVRDGMDWPSNDWLASLQGLLSCARELCLVRLQGETFLGMDAAERLFGPLNSNELGDLVWWADQHAMQGRVEVSRTFLRFLKRYEHRRHLQDAASAERTRLRKKCRPKHTTDESTEARVLQMLAKGVPAADIAKTLRIHRNTVRNIKRRKK